MHVLLKQCYDFLSFNHSAKEKADVDNLDIKSFLNKEAFDQSMSKEKVRERERERERERVCVCVYMYYGIYM